MCVCVCMCVCVRVRGGERERRKEKKKENERACVCACGVKGKRKNDESEMVRARVKRWIWKKTRPCSAADLCLPYIRLACIIISTINGCTHLQMSHLEQLEPETPDSKH